MISIGVIFGLVASAFVVWYIRHRVRYAERNRQLKKLKTLSVPSFPLVGQAWYFIGSTQRAVRLIYEALAKSDAPLVVWFGVIPSVHLTRSEDIEYVAKTYTDRNTYGFLETTIGNGIVSQNREMWKTTRRLLTPAFAPNMLTQYLRAFNEQSMILVDQLQQKAIEGQTFDLWLSLLHANIDTISDNAIGIKPDSQKNQGREYAKALTSVVFATVNRLLNPLLYPDFAFNIHSHFTGVARQIKTVHEYPIEPLKEALNNMDRERTSLSSENSASEHMIDILLAHHLNNPGNLTEKQMILEMNHLTVVGSEALAITVGFLMLMYGMHQDEQELVYRELKSVVPDDRPITMEDLNQLVYLEQTIKETLRLYSTLPVTYRSIEHALTLPAQKYQNSVRQHLESGHRVIMLGLVSSFREQFLGPDFERQFANSRNERTFRPFTDAQKITYNVHDFCRKWNPANFSVEAVNGRPQNSFAPFGWGLRACMGPKYAMLSMKVQVSHLVRKYHISTDTKLEEIVLEQDLFRRSRDGYRIKLRIRDS